MDQINKYVLLGATFITILAFNNCSDNGKLQDNSQASTASNAIVNTTPPAPTQPPPAPVVTPPTVPSNLLAKGMSQSEIDLSWTDNSASNETGFKIERATSSNGPFTQIAIVGTGVLTYTDLALPTFTKYFYRIYSYNSTGNSAYTSVVAGVTQPPPNAPAFASGVVATATGATVTLSGPVVKLRYFDDFTNGYVDVPGAPYPSPLNVAITYPAGTTFICFQAAGSDGVYEGAFVGDPQSCNKAP